MNDNMINVERVVGHQNGNGRVATPESAASIPISLHGYLSEPESLHLKKMAALGFRPAWNGSETPKAVEWDSSPIDLEMFQEVAKWLNADEMSDQDFDAIVRINPEDPAAPSIEGFIKASPHFRRLASAEGLKNGYKNSPLEHILQMHEFLETEELDAGLRRKLRHVAFFHDLGKVTDPNDSSHGLGSSLIAKTYYAWANEQAAASGEEQPYSDDFVKDVEFLCRNHHFFGQAAGYLTEEMKALIESYRAKERPGISKEESMAEEEAFLEVMMQLDNPVQPLDYESIRLKYPELVKNPQLLNVIIHFTIADIKASESHSVYNTRNWGIYVLLNRVFTGNYPEVGPVEPSRVR